MRKIIQTILQASDSGSLTKIIFAGKRKKSLEYSKITLRPVTIRGEYMYQAEFHFEKKVTHQNIPYHEMIDYASQWICEDFKQINILTEAEDIQILAADPEKPRITRRAYKKLRKAAVLDHNRKKHYIIEDGKPCDFLIKLGVMSPEGKVFQKHYSKFRQINRFLEIADDSFRDLPSQGTLRIIDFGCGKSYLTFALYYYLRVLKNRDVAIVGLDLKKDVIEFTSLEHTARNVMIKAVLPDPAALTEKQLQKQKAAKEKASQEYEALKNVYHVHPTIDQL